MYKLCPTKLNYVFCLFKICVFNNTNKTWKKLEECREFFSLKLEYIWDKLTNVIVEDC